MSQLFHDPHGDPLLDKGKVLLATTCYDKPSAAYVFSIARTREALHRAGTGTEYLLLAGNCHVDDARNTVVAEFLRGDCEYLMFLDADVSWEPEDIVRLCGHNLDVVGGVYPYRRDGSEGMPVRNKPGCFEPDKDGLLEVDGLPTGFMKIRRNVLEKLAAEARTFVKNGQEISIVFERDVYNGGRRGGDIGFCMKWGGPIYALADLRLGHTGTGVLRDSLAAFLRRQVRGSLRHVCDRVRAGEETVADLHEACAYMANPWTPTPDWLQTAVLLARKCTGDVLEAGSGLSTILMAAANPDVKIWAMEHDPVFATKLEQMAAEAGVGNVMLVHVPIRDGFYDVSADRAVMPARFSLGVVDGPPRLMGDRMKFFDAFGDACTMVLCDDVDDAGYANKLETWADENGRAYRKGDHRAAVIMEAA